MKNLEESILKAMRAGIFKAYLLLEYTRCTDLDEFCGAVVSLVKKKKIRISEVTGYFELV